jgi:hypothetical protein
MKEKIRHRINALQADFQTIAGSKFRHFYCPILYRDEDVTLCRAHIINNALPDSARNWTIQRKDVDNFYGNVFESDFMAIKYKNGRTVADAFVDRDLSHVLKPRILADGEPIEYYRSSANGPDYHSKLMFEHQGKSAELWLRMSPSELLAKHDVRWEIEVERDIRIPAFVSLIKAAHLTLFYLLGYRYALSAGGQFIGFELLGRFFLSYHGFPKQECQKKALAHFVEWQHLVRPIESVAFPVEGTLSDKQLLICRNLAGRYWAFIVLVRIMRTLHAVMLPTFITPEDIAFYLDFIKNNVETIEVCWGQFKGDHWEISKATRKLRWPKTGVLMS